jgi:signal transduction histidine kinase
VGLIVVAPLTATLGFLLDADAFFTYGMPLVTVAVQGLLLVGIVRMRFYDVEVRVSRVGRLSAETLSTARLAALGTLAASLAHEVRNPLTGVRSLAQRFRDDALDDEQRRNYADVIVRESDRVTRLVERILGVSRRLPPPVGPGEPTALGPLFDDLTLLAGPRAKERGVDLRCEATDATAVASREVLTQVLLNLVLNGVDHSPRGGCVAVAARSEPDGMVIEVSDQGPGIPPEHRTRVFEPYWSADGGTGIGLSVVKQLVADHRWQLLLDDAPGGGARIRVRVPAASTSGS